MISDTIRNLRMRYGITQSELAEKLSVSRSSVNAWELGISQPTLRYIKKMTKVFNVSSDFLLEIDTKKHVIVEGLTDDDIDIIKTLVKTLRSKNEKGDIMED